MWRTVERAVAHGLLPVVTATSSGDQWTVTISLAELELAVEQRAATRAAAEAAAVASFDAEFDRLLTSPDVCETYPSTRLTLKNCIGPVLRYCHVILNTQAPELSVSGDPRTGYIAWHLFDGKPRTEPASSAHKSAAIKICKLATAQKILSGHIDFWPNSSQNPMRPSIVISQDTVNTLERAAAKAREVLSSHPPGVEQSNGETDSSYVVQRLIELPLPPGMTKMLVLGAITNALDAAIIMAALHSSSVLNRLSPILKRTQHGTDGDHITFVHAFTKLRMRMEQASDAAMPVSLPQYSYLATQPARILQSIDTAAQNIEQLLQTASIIKLEPDPSGQLAHKQVPGMDLEVKGAPYGSRHEAADLSMLRKLLLVGFGDNVAACLPQTLESDTLLMRIRSEGVRNQSGISFQALKTRLARCGPLAIISGRQSSPFAQSLSSQPNFYETPITPLLAVLLGTRLSTPKAPSPNPPGEHSVNHVELLVNDWASVIVKSDVDSLSHDQARDLIVDTRKLLHRAVDKAMADFLRHDWRQPALSQMFACLPNIQEAPVPKVKHKVKKAQVNSHGPAPVGPTAGIVTEEIAEQFTAKPTVASWNPHWFELTDKAVKHKVKKTRVNGHIPAPVGPTAGTVTEEMAQQFTAKPTVASRNSTWSDLTGEAVNPGREKLGPATF